MASLPIYTRLEEATATFPDFYALSLESVKGFSQVLNGQRKFADVYKDTDPLAISLLASFILSICTFVLSEITRNYSQVDRLWSLLPAIYICHYSYWARINGLWSERVDTAAIVAIIWSIRLTFNYWRKGGYQWSSEDYRWEVIKDKMGKPAFFLLNITFISFLQNFLLVAITTPVYLFLILAKNFPTTEAITTADTVFSRAMALAILLEFFADQQQWNFHQAKDSYKRTGKVPGGWDKDELERGFLYSGLWAFSRHPNFVGEQAVWVLLYQWSAMVTDSLYNWTFVGAISYCLLFQGSTWFTEVITAGKYKDYRVYQKHVSMFLPRVQSIKEGGFYFPDGETQKTD